MQPLLNVKRREAQVFFRSRRSGSKVAEPHSLLQEFKHGLVERLVEDDAAFASTGPNDGREDFNRTRTDQQLLTGACALA